ncbi:uncharacterized protein LOC103732403 [Nannospalax galili]|uniref:uncharacterized protein LOC103732403 n=1 Tax=Nannospalax galili TaxID=1026970 RepID=UPI00111C26B5|nr:uncharacterized protein LOC103732403 [Nannospalax galili]
MSTSVTSETAPKHQNPRKKGGKKKVPAEAMTDQQPKNSFVSTETSYRQNDTEKEVPESSLYLAENDKCKGGGGPVLSCPQMFTCKFKVYGKFIGTHMAQVGSSNDHMGSSLPAPSQASSSDASGVVISKQRTRRKRGQRKRKLVDVEAGTCPPSSLIFVPARRARYGNIHSHLDFVPAVAQKSSLQASSTALSESVSELKFCRRGKKRSLWTVDHIEGTKLWINKRKRPSYRPEDHYLELGPRMAGWGNRQVTLLKDPVIKSFLAADLFFSVTDKYLLSMVVEYFGRVGLPGHLYNRIHFFLALYIACDTEEDDSIPKGSIFQFLLGKETWQDFYKEFLKLKKDFFRAMGHRDWVTPELCEEIQNQNPHHWVWSRVRQGTP